MPSLSILIALVALGLPVQSAPGTSRADTVALSQPFTAGDQLEAVRDVNLREAKLSKGSRVTVVKVSHDRGQPVSVSLELKDGHVLHGVAYRKVRQHFRRVQ